MKHPSVLLPSKFPSQLKPRRGFDYKSPYGGKSIYEIDSVDKRLITSDIEERIQKRLSQKKLDYTRISIYIILTLSLIVWLLF